jgi:hypothetical protein
MNAREAALNKATRGSSGFTLPDIRFRKFTHHRKMLKKMEKI